MKPQFKLLWIALLLLGSMACKRTETENQDMTETETYFESPAPTAADSINPSASGTTVDTTSAGTGMNSTNNGNNTDTGSVPQ